jgi:tetratricopeptide (TPR) repeat protein
MASMPLIERRRQSTVEKDKGNENYKAGDHKQAVECYTLALELLTDDDAELAATVRANRAQAYIKLGMWKDTELDCNEALALVPGHMKALMRRARARFELKNPADALADAEAALAQVGTVAAPTLQHQLVSCRNMQVCVRCT